MVPSSPRYKHVAATKKIWLSTMELQDISVEGALQVSEEQILNVLDLVCEGHDISFVDYDAGQEVTYAYIPADVMNFPTGPPALAELQSIESLTNVDLQNEDSRCPRLTNEWVSWLLLLRLKFLSLSGFKSVDEFIYRCNSFVDLLSLAISGACMKVEDFASVCGIEALRTIRFRGEILGAVVPEFVNPKVLVLTLIGTKFQFDLLKLVKCLPELRVLNVDVWQIQPSIHEIRMSFPKCSVNVCTDDEDLVKAQ
jgi:hypothetical protein